MKKVAVHLLAIILILIFASPSISTPFVLERTTDIKISTSFTSGLVDLFKDAYSIISGVERDVIADGIDSGSICYVGFDLNLDKLFNYNEVTSYNNMTDQVYAINTLNVEVKLKDDNYSVFGVDFGNDIPHEYGRIDIQLWTENTDTFGGSWPSFSFFGDNVYEINDGATYTFNLDFSQKPLNYSDWYNHGEIIVTAWYPELFANCDFIVDSVKIWGDRSIYVRPEPSEPVPEPSTMLLFCTGLVGLVGVARRKKK